MTHRLLLLCLSSLLVAACAGAPELTEPPRVGKKSATDLLFEIRTAELEGNDALEVQPLDDSAVADLRVQAEMAEARGDFAAAELAYSKALGLLPESPGLLQAHAEMLLVLGKLDSAESNAARAYELGPKLGPLCRRSWATVRLARELRGNAAAAGTANEQAQRCATPPPVRM